MTITNLVTRLSDLVEENAKLREQLAVANAALFDRELVFPSLKLQPQCARLLQMLYKARPNEVLSQDNILTGFYAERPDCDWAGRKIIDVRICQLRKALPPESITTIWGRGYLLSEEGREFVTKLIEEGKK